MLGKQRFSLILLGLIPIIFLLTPAPEELSLKSWYFLGLFLTVVLGLVLEPFPPALIGFMGISTASAFQMIDPIPSNNLKWALSGFSHPIIWIIFSIFIFSIGYQKSGLGRRISLILIKYLGKSSLGLGYAIAFSDLALAPFLPSSTARSAGILYPIIINIPTILHSSPSHHRLKIGAYLTWVSVVSMCITGSMFLTVLAPHLLMVHSLLGSYNVSVSLNIWMQISLYLLLPLFIVTPFLIYCIYPPLQKNLPDASLWAKKELALMGKMCKQEILMAFFAVMALLSWMFASKIGVDATILVFWIIIGMIFSGLITWDDIMKNASAWNVFIWFSTLLTLSSGLHHLGLTQWIGERIELCLVTLSSHMVMTIMLILFFFLHYFFASLIAHVSVLLPLFASIASKYLLADQLSFFVVMLSCSIGLMGVLTPYSTGASPIWYSAGYITQKEWWGLGAVFGLLFLAVCIAGIFILV